MKYDAFSEIPKIGRIHQHSWDWTGFWVISNETSEVEFIKNGKLLGGSTQQTNVVDATFSLNSDVQLSQISDGRTALIGTNEICNWEAVLNTCD